MGIRDKQLPPPRPQPIRRPGGYYPDEELLLPPEYYEKLPLQRNPAYGGKSRSEELYKSIPGNDVRRTVDAKPLPGAEVRSYDKTWHDTLADLALGLGLPEQTVAGLFGSTGIGPDPRVPQGTGLVDLSPAGPFLNVAEYELDRQRSGGKSNPMMAAAAVMPGGKALGEVVGDVAAPLSKQAQALAEQLYMKSVAHLPSGEIKPFSHLPDSKKFDFENKAYTQLQDKTKAIDAYNAGMLVEKPSLGALSDDEALMMSKYKDLYGVDMTPGELENWMKSPSVNFKFLDDHIKIHKDEALNKSLKGWLEKAKFGHEKTGEFASGNAIGAQLGISEEALPKWWKGLSQDARDELQRAWYAKKPMPTDQLDLPMKMPKSGGGWHDETLYRGQSSYEADTGDVYQRNIGHGQRSRGAAWFTPDEDIANEYAGFGGGGQRPVFEAQSRGKELDVSDIDGLRQNELDALKIAYDNLKKEDNHAAAGDFDEFIERVTGGDLWNYGSGLHAQNAVLRELEEQGFDSVRLNDFTNNQYHQSVVVFDPENFGKLRNIDATYEEIPYAKSGHLGAPNIVDPKGFTKDRSWDRGYGGFSGGDERDELLKTLGAPDNMPVYPSGEAAGFWKEFGKDTFESNPAIVARPQGRFVQGELDPNDRATLDAAANVRAYTDVQGGVGYGAVVPRTGDAFSRSNALSIPTNGQLTPEDMLSLSGITEDLPGFEFMADTGNALKIVGKDHDALSSLLDAAPRFQEATKKGMGDAGKLNTHRAFTGEHVGGYADYTDAWQKPAGSGTATAQLQESLTQRQITQLDNNPNIREIMRTKNALDKAYARDNNVPIRVDVINARDIIAREGFSGLFAALKTGWAYLPAAALVSLPALRAYLGLDGQTGAPKL